MIWQVGIHLCHLLGRVNLYGIYVGDNRAEEVHR